ncbi:MAG: exopolysaccharide biosynthesis polyprenyl glycosylphosphotransferase [Labilithrix sp.]|nr:exopolysaccharide biosynthesis polyprenyl glycosylphosphotransferase [Labilithrix sp.]
MSDPESGGAKSSSVTELPSETDDPSGAPLSGAAPLVKSAPPSGAPPTTKERVDVAATQASAVSPLHSPEAKARLEAKKRLGQTAIGIAPPAVGSHAPPGTTTGGTTSASPRPVSVPPPAPTASERPPATASERPPAIERPPGTASSTQPFLPADVTAPANKGTSPAAFTDTLVAAAPPPVHATADHPLAATARSAAVGPDGAPRPPAKTLIGTAPPPAVSVQPAPIVPRRRTPAQGMPATNASFSPKVTPIAGTLIPKITPAAGTPAEPLVASERVVVKEKEPGLSVPPPIIRIPQGGLLGGSTSSTMKHAGTLICEILVKNGAVTEEMVSKALALQEERGGQIGRILVSMGACTEEAIARALIEQLKTRKDEGHLSDISTAAREQKDVVGLKVLTRPGRTIATLFLTDLFSLVLAALLATSVHWLRTYSELGEIDWTAWLVVGPAVALCMLTFLGLELYSPMAKSTPDEIRDITFAASLVHLGASVLSTLGDLPIVKWGVFVRGVWWAATLFLVPVIRSLVRGYLSVQPWWGIPVCVLGAAKTGRLVVRTLKAQPRSGLKPVMMLDDDINKHGTLRASFTNEVMDVYSVNLSAAHFLTESQRAELASDIFGDEAERAGQPISSDHIPIAAQTKVEVSNTPGSQRPPPEPKKTDDRSSETDFFNPDSQRLSRSPITKDASQFPRGKFAEVDGVPLVGDLSLAPVLAARLKIPYAVLAMPGVDSAKLLHIVERIGGKFTHLLIIPDLFGFATMGVPAKSLGGILGVEVRQQLLLPGPRLAKRIMDVALTCFGAIFVLPFLLLIAALIKLDSKGPVFYTQKRLGKDGTYFSAYKFRTMHGDGEARLKAILDADPALRAEYDIYHKLKKDPRVTRIGRVLRKFSLDEFPQLLNVIKGDMSLVGPRPYIERELTEMSGQEKIILRAPPGMTGMWQVSDRNATSFAQRVQIDVYYVRNWSPWLDIHILAKTFGVVIKGSGV